jgi:hypothetical protein
MFFGCAARLLDRFGGQDLDFGLGAQALFSSERREVLAALVSTRLVQSAFSLFQASSSGGFTPAERAM